MSGAKNNPLSMSDEDFLNLNDPSELPGAEAQEEVAEEEEQQGEDAAEEEVEEQQEEESSEGDDDKSAAEEDSEAEAGEDETSEEEDKPAAGEAGTQEKSSEEEVSDEKDEQKQEQKKETSDVPADVETLQSFYKQIMAPFQANGKTIQAKTPEEVITLMQMGANYTKKMQDIQPHRKVLMMLEDNGLLDQAKLGYLLDLKKGDKAAITKLLKDTGVDPMDIDTESDPNYLGGTHQISDEQANFREAVQEVAQSDSGKETLQIVDGWDNASKDEVWKDPNILRLIQSQRDNGVYDQIVSELDRRKTLGTIPANTPFLQAYSQIGSQLFPPANPDQGPKPKVKVAEKVAKPKPTVSNGDKASAAAPSRSTPRKTGQVINPLAMSDEEFAKMANIQL